MGRFKAVFLDVGGTLLGMGDPPSVYRQILADHGYRFDVETVREAQKAAREASLALPCGPFPDQTIDAERESARRDWMVRDLLRRLGVVDGFEECRRAIWQSWLGTDVFRRYPEVGPVLARLKAQGYVVGAISNWERRLELLLTNHGLASYLDFVLASEAEGHVKPGLYLYEKALRLAGVQPEEAMHVGDSYEHDVEAPQSLGITAVLLSRNGRRPVDYSPIIRSLEEVLPLLQAREWVQGRVTSGAGVAAGFTRVPWVRQQVEERLGFVPYPGTLNILPASPADMAAVQQLRSEAGVPLTPESGYCAARCFPVTVEGRVPAAVVVPEVRGYPDHMVELLAPVCLRDELDLEDGSLVTVAVPAEGGRPSSPGPESATP